MPQAEAPHTSVFSPHVTREPGFRWLSPRTSSAVHVPRVGSLCVSVLLPLAWAPPWPALGQLCVRAAPALVLPPRLPPAAGPNLLIPRVSFSQGLQALSWVELVITALTGLLAPPSCFFAWKGGVCSFVGRSEWTRSRRSRQGEAVSSMLVLQGGTLGMCVLVVGLLAQVCLDQARVWRCSGFPPRPQGVAGSLAGAGPGVRLWLWPFSHLGPCALGSVHLRGRLSLVTALRVIP